MTQRKVRAYLLDIEQACALLARFTSGRPLPTTFPTRCFGRLLSGSSRSSAKRSTAGSLSIRG